MAVLSDVNAILDNRLSLGLIAFTYAGETDTLPDRCPTVRIPAKSGGFGVRFARGLFRNLPPSAERFYGTESSQAILEALKKWSPPTVIIDDASVAGFIPQIRSLLPAAKIILRSHNVMHDLRTEHLRRTTGPSRLPIAFDRRRYIELERAAVLNSDRHWAITPADATRMAELYGRPGECLSVSVPMERYEQISVDQGRSNAFSHVGSLDFRRRADLGGFLEKSWPTILKADSDATLTLAGDLKGDPIPAPNVTYSGRVDSDAAVYSSARFALNFQTSPGGVKLKTLTCLAAGRTLLSTSEGVEGVDVQSGCEFFLLDQFLAKGDLSSILADAHSTQSVAIAGRQYIQDHHSRPAVARRLLSLLEKI